MEAALRRKYTLIDKNDFAAISAVQKVRTHVRFLSPKTFPEAAGVLPGSPCRVGTDGVTQDECGVARQGQLMWLAGAPKTGDKANAEQGSSCSWAGRGRASQGLEPNARGGTWGGDRLAGDGLSWQPPPAVSYTCPPEPSAHTHLCPQKAGTNP